MIKQRCEWAKTDLLLMQYHDDEWGTPVFNGQMLFEFLTLEGMQAGLSWLTILKKREHFRAAFDNFDVKKIASYDINKFNALINDAGLIRNKLKIQSVINNAHAFLEVEKELGDFSKYLWNFVNGKPILNQWQSASQIPAQSAISDLMAKDLKKRGFKFVGSKICYALMQATGMVNDHTINCFRHQTIKKSGLPR